MNTPVIGQHVAYWGQQGETRYDANKPLAAVVAYVWSPTLVNLTVFDHGGTAMTRSSVRYEPQTVTEGSTVSGYVCTPPPMPAGAY